MHGGVGGQQVAIGRDDLRGEEVVTRQAVEAREPPQAPAEGQTGQTDARK
jgi:hypothetical protein